MKRDPELIDRYTAWCKNELFTPQIISATQILHRICDLYLQSLYRKLRLNILLQTPKTAEQVTKELGFVPSASSAIENALRRLSDRSGIVSFFEGRFRAVKDPADPGPELAHLRAELSKLGDEYIAAMDFLDFGASHFVGSLSTDPDFMDRVLSGRDDQFAELWHRATNIDPLQDLHGKMGAQAVLELLDRTSSILEVGGGTGNGTRHLFAMAKRRGCLDCIDRYIFTDISMRFILTTKHEIEREYPGIRCEWKLCDINKPLAAQKISPESIDMIYGVNAAHVAKDLVEFLCSCNNTLKPGGAVVFSERVRMRPQEMAPRELTLNLSTYHRTAAQKASYRPMHAYLSPPGWEEAIARADLDAMILPDLDAISSTFPDQYAAVIVGFKR